MNTRQPRCGKPLRFPIPPATRTAGVNDGKWRLAGIGGATAIVWLATGSIRDSVFAAGITTVLATAVTLLLRRRQTGLTRGQRKTLARLDAEMIAYLPDHADLTNPGGELR